MAVTLVAAAAAQNAGVTTPAATAAITPTVTTTSITNVPKQRCFVFQSHSCETGSAATPANWTASYKDVVVGTGTASAAGGRRFISCYWRDWDGSWTMPSFALASATQNSHAIATLTVMCDPTETFDTPTFSGDGEYFGTAGTAFSAATPAAFNAVSKAFLMAHSVTNDNVTATSGAITGSGFTSGTVTERADGGTATGNDVTIKLHTCSPTTGANVALTHTMTLSAASQGGWAAVQQTATYGGSTPSNAFLYDTFRDPDATLLENHTGEAGATWAKQTGWTGTGNFAGNRVHGLSSTEAHFYSSGTPPSADYEVSADVYCLTNLTFTFVGVMGRMNTAANTGYAAFVLMDGSAVCRIYLKKFVTGTGTDLTLGIAVTSPVAGSTHTIKLRMVGTSIKSFWDGVEIGSVTDSAITAAGRAGVENNGVGSATTGYHLENVTATQYPPPPNAGTASGAYTFAGTATGKFTAKGSASGAYTFAGSATGEAPEAAVNEGSASGAYTFAGTASGARTSRGTASGAYTFAGTAAGKLTAKGSASGAYTFAGTAAGSAPTVGAKTGSASGAYTFAGSADGESALQGSSTGSYTFAGAATGARTSSGTASGSYTFVGTAAGKRTPKASASGAYTFAGSATGSAPAGWQGPVLAAVGTRLAIASSTAANVPIPAGVAEGDIILVGIGIYGAATLPTITPPAGFTEAASSPGTSTYESNQAGVRMFWKRQTAATGAGETTGTYNFTLSAARFRMAHALRFTGSAAAGDPFDVTTSAGNASDSTSFPTVSLTTTVDNTLMVWFGGAWDGFTLTPPTGFTIIAQGPTDNSEAGEYFASKQQGTAGATGSLAGTQAGNNAKAVWLGALEPVGVAPNEGSASGAYTFAGTATGARTSRGSASGSYTFAGTTAGSRTSTGSASGAYTFAGTATGRKSSAGTASGSYTFAGTAAGKRTPKATASGSYTFVGNTEGESALQGSASGSYTFAGTATGNTPPNSGAATGSYNFTGATTGARTSRGSASGAYTFAGGAVGQAPIVGVESGSAIGAYTFSGTTTGARTSRGSAAGSYNFSGTAAGKHTSRGSASGAYTFTGTATGDTPAVGAKTGTASGSYAFTGTTTGARTSRGLAGGGYTWAGSVTGKRTPKATSAGGYTFGGAAVGDTPNEAVRQGSAFGTYNFAGAATGARISLGSAAGNYGWAGSTETTVVPVYHPSQTLTLGQEVRTMSMSIESRTMTMPAETRLITMPGENRTATITGENRSITLPEENRVATLDTETRLISL